MSVSPSLPESIDELQRQLSSKQYVADSGLATTIYLALRLKRPLLLEGEAGVGKTEVAKVLSAVLETDLIRLQCYEGLDITQAVYEWNYPRQMVEIRMSEGTGGRDRDALESDLFSDRFLIKRPLLQALESDDVGAPVLLIDEIDRADDEFELAGLTKAPSVLVKPPRVAEAPISFECKTWKTIELPAAEPDVHNIMVLGEVVGVHIADDALNDGLIDTAGLRPVARLGYLDYSVVDGVFAMPRPK